MSDFLGEIEKQRIQRKILALSDIYMIHATQIRRNVFMKIGRGQ